MRISAYLEPSGTVLWNRPDIVRDAEVAGSNPVASTPWQGAGCPVDIRSAPTEAERRCRKPRELAGFRFFFFRGSPAFSYRLFPLPFLPGLTVWLKLILFFKSIVFHFKTNISERLNPYIGIPKCNA